MASRSHPCWRALWPTTLLVAAAFSPAVAAAAEPPAAEPPPAAATAAVPRTVVVGQAKISFYLRPAAPGARPALVERFRRATAAHLTGGEPPLSAKSEPVVLPGGQVKLALPAELIHTMFVTAEGQSYCSDSSVAARPAADRQAAGEER